MKSRIPLILTLFIVIYTAVFFFFACMRSLSSCCGDADLGLFGQSFYTTLFCGDLFFNTYEGGSHFQMHNSPVFILLLPFYAIHPSLYTLLFIMTFALALGAVPVYLIASEKLSERAGLVFAALYLLYHPLHGVNYEQFHELAFVVTPLLFSYYFFMKRRLSLFWLCCIIAMLCKEEISISLAAYGAYICYHALVECRDITPSERKRLIAHGCALAALSMTYLYLSLYVIIPYFRGGAYTYVSGRYGEYGGSIGKVALNLLVHPQLVFRAFWDDVARVHYVVELLLPLAFLSLWGFPVLAIAVPNLMINIMSSYSTMYLTGSRYPSALIAFIFISAIIGAEKLMRRGTGTDLERSRKLRRILAFPIVLTVLCALFLNPSPLRLYFTGAPPFVEIRYPRVIPHQQTILDLAAKFPENASIATQSGIYHHLCNRKEVYCGFRDGVDYIFVDTRSRWYTEHAAWARDLPRLVEEGKYIEIYNSDYIKIYRRADLKNAVDFSR